MKIVTIMLKFDYGIKERGISLEKEVLLPAIKASCEEVTSFWIEENGYYEDTHKLQNNIFEFVETEHPNIIFFVLMKDEISSETLKKLSNKYITINWFSDDQWRFDSFTKFIAPMLSYSITMDKYSLKKYKKIHCKAILSQWAVSEYLDTINLDNVKYNYEISFVGGRNNTREWIIYELRKSGYNIECFGDGWNNGRITSDKMKDIFLTSKINLNLSNSVPNSYTFKQYERRKLFSEALKNMRTITLKNPVQYFKNILRPIVSICKNQKGEKDVEQIKARNFEIPGCGGFQISQYALEIEDYYNIGKEIVVYSTLVELKKQIDYYLDNDIERKEIAKAAYKRTKEYTYEKRFKDIFKEVII